MGSQASSETSSESSSDPDYRLGCCPRRYVCYPHYHHCCHSAPDSEKSTVANATGKKLKIFYHKEKIKVEDVLTKADSSNTKRFKPNTGFDFIDLPPKEHLECPSLEEGFASAFAADEKDSEVYVETIALNYQVLLGACVIVTAKKEIKFRKSDGGVWIDEDGKDHRPQ